MGMPFMSTSMSPMASVAGPPASNAFFLGLDLNTTAIIISIAASTLVITVTIIISSAIITRKLRNHIQRSMDQNPQGNVINKFGGKSDSQQRYVKAGSKGAKVPEDRSMIPLPPTPVGNSILRTDDVNLYDYSSLIKHDPRALQQMPRCDVRQNSVVYENYKV